MPQWIHDRARHIQGKNPGMEESTAFAVATQQAHAVGKSPKGFGTSAGRSEAKEKYDTPKDDKKTADPGGIGEKVAEVKLLAPFMTSFADEIEKIANLSGQSDSANPAQLGVIKTPPMKNLSKPGQVPRYSNVNSGTSTSPIAQHQPMLAAPPVKT